MPGTPAVHLCLFSPSLNLENVHTSTPGIVGEPQPGVGILALGTHERGRVTGPGRKCAGSDFSSSLHPVFGAVDRPLDYSSLRQMVLTHYINRGSHLRASHLDSTFEKGDDLKSKKKGAI